MALMAGMMTVQAKSTDRGTELRSYPGFYAAGPFQVVEVTVSDNQLAVQPPYWSSRPNLAPLGDTAYFQSLPQTDRRRVVKFGDFAQGAPKEIELSGFGKDNEGVRFRRVVAGREPPGLLVLKGQPTAAATRAMQAAIGDVATFALRTVQSRPRSAESVVAFIDQYLRMKSVQPTADMLFARGLGRLMLRQRQGALSDFKAVVALQPGNDGAKEYVALLNVSEPPEGEGYRKLLPFKLDDLYVPPTSSEIAAVLTDWASRDLAPGKVEAVYSTTLNCGGARYNVRILKHDNRGAAHYGALLLPRGSKGRLAAIIDVR